MASPTDVQAGQAHVDFYLRMENWRRGLSVIGRDISTMSRKLNVAGRKMAVSGIIASMPFIAGTKVYANFSKQLAFVATMLDEPQKYMSGYTAGIRKMAIEFGESTETLSRGLYDILSASFAPAQALEMLRVTAKAAKAGMADTASATKAIIAVLNAYGLGAEKAQYVSDALFTVVRYGVLTFGELAGHIGLVASTAAIAGVSIEEMGALLAVMTRAGVETSHAVVALNNVIRTFLKPTEDAKAFAKDLREAGINIQLTAKALKERGVIDIFKELAKLPAGAIAKLFPSLRALRGVAPAISKMEGLLDTYSKMQDVTGATDRAMQEVAKSFGFLVDRVKQAGMVILTYVGEALEDVLRPMGEDILTIATGFGLWVKQNKVLIVYVAKLAAGLVILGGVMLAVSKIMGVMAAITLVMAGPMGWKALITGVIAAAASFGILLGVLGKVKSELNEMRELGKKEATSGITASAGKRLSVALGEYRRLKRMLDKGEVMPRGTYGELEAGRWGGVAGWEKQQRRLMQERVRFLGFQIPKLREGFNLEQKSLLATKKKTTELEKQAALMNQITGNFMRSYRLGYYHTPSMRFTSIGTGDQQVELLAGIKANTAATVAAVKANKVKME